MISSEPADAAEPTPLQERYAFTCVITVLTQFFLTALWAGLGTEPCTFRVRTLKNDNH